MSLIPCICDCYYQKDGYCTLEHIAATVGNFTDEKNACMNFRAKNSLSEDRQSLTNIFDRDKH